MTWTKLRRESCVHLVACLTALLLVLALCSCRDDKRVSLTISAAASLQETLSEIETLYRFGHTKVDFRNNFGSSGTLAREIEQGAPVDVFISAAAKPMDDLEEKGWSPRDASESRAQLAGSDCTARLKVARICGTRR